MIWGETKFNINIRDIKFKMKAIADPSGSNHLKALFSSNWKVAASKTLDYQQNLIYQLFKQIKPPKVKWRAGRSLIFPWFGLHDKL